MAEDPPAEGWYLDPFGRHEHRWFSDGRPTALVRDNGVEAQDQPPRPESPSDPIPVPEGDVTSEDMRRADDGETVPAADDYGTVAMDAAVQMGFGR